MTSSEINFQSPIVAYFPFSIVNCAFDAMKFFRDRLREKVGP